MRRGTRLAPVGGSVGALAVEKARSGGLDVPEESPARVIASHHDTEGRLLTTEVAAVELLNLLRPIVAIARFVTFAALALHERPERRRRLRAQEDGYDELFVQEVRRFYPFFPFIGGRVLNAFDWRGRRFAEGTWIILDLHNTDHDPSTWEDPEEFGPERFRRWDENAFDFFLQGAGTTNNGRRCPGEWTMVEVTKRAACLPTKTTTYDVVPEQVLGVGTSKMPTVSESRFVISNVRCPA